VDTWLLNRPAYPKQPDTSTQKGKIMATSQFPPDPEGNVLEAQREDWAIPGEIAGVKIPDSDLAHGIMDLVRAGNPRRSFSTMPSVLTC